MTTGPGAANPAGSRAELIDRFFDLQPRVRRWMTRAMPADLHVEMGAVTMQQMHALHTIKRRGAMTMGELAESLAASLSSATQMADRLVRFGLVERMSDPADRRLVRVALSPRGAEIFERREAAWRQAVAQALEGLSDEECAILVRVLERTAGVHAPEDAGPWSAMPWGATPAF